MKFKMNPANPNLIKTMGNISPAMIAGKVYKIVNLKPLNTIIGTCIRPNVITKYLITKKKISGAQISIER